MARFPRQQLYIHGGYVDASSNETFESINPANGEVLAEVAEACLLYTSDAADE